MSSVSTIAEDSSGSKRKQGSINKHGNPRIRHQLVEAVWRLPKWQPQYPPLKQLQEASGTRARKRAAVAVARRLAVDLWRISTGQCSAQKLGLVAALIRGRKVEEAMNILAFSRGRLRDGTVRLRHSFRISHLNPKPPASIRQALG